MQYFSSGSEPSLRLLLRGRDQSRAVYATRYHGGVFLSVCIISSGTAASLSGNLSGHLSISSSPYIVTGNVTIPVGQSLNIDPGVLIKMSPGINWTVNGILVASGTVASPIVFSSLLEGTTSAAPGQWGALQFNNSTSATQLPMSKSAMVSKSFLARLLLNSTMSPSPACPYGRSNGSDLPAHRRRQSSIFKSCQRPRCPRRDPDAIRELEHYGHSVCDS